MKQSPPVAKQIPHTFTHHGITTDDPWHWLKDPGYPDVKDEAVLDYLRAENEFFESHMDEHKSLTERIFDEIRGRMKEDDAAVPWKDGDYLYRWRFETGSEYRLWSRQPVDGGDEVVILNEPEEAAGLEYYSMADLDVSPDGNLMAWSVDDNGSERFTIRVKDLRTGEVINDVIEETLGGVVWANDGSGFFYTRVNKEWRPEKVFFHVLGERQDRLVYQEQDSSFFVHIGQTQSDKWLVIAAGDHVTSEVRLVPLDEPGKGPQLIAARRSGHEYQVDHAGDTFFILTNDRHKNFRLVTAPEDSPTEDAWKELLAPSDDHYYRGHVAFRDFLVVQERVRGIDQIRVRSHDGDEHFIEFPEPVYSASIGNNPEYDQGHVRIGYSSMVTPQTVYDYDVEGRTLELRKQQEIPSGYDPSRYTTERLMAPSRDGVEIPVTLVYPTGLLKDGSGLLHLYGYGAYGFGQSPSFSASRLSLVDRGFAYAIAHVRGGDEMGYHWYEAGKLKQRTNTFNDFVDVARFLASEGYTSEGNISASGGSAGGELMGAAVIQAPELWRAVVMHVPFVDVLNTMLDDSLPLTPIEWPEWGNPIESKEDFETIAAYSPYDHIEARDYPMQLVTGGLNDPRVTYWEPAKWTAKMRATKTDDNLLLMKINMGAGHGGKTGRYQRIQETAEEFTFILKAFGLTNE